MDFLWQQMYIYIMEVRFTCLVSLLYNKSYKRKLNQLTSTQHLTFLSIVCILILSTLTHTAL